MTRVLLAVAFLFLVGGLVVVLLAGSLTAGVFIFSTGVVLLGVRALVEGGDRATGAVLIAIGSLAAAADLVRLLLVAGGT